jgi:uncharacterized surface protein with fasciclin (FAS1) repeats
MKTNKIKFLGAIAIFSMLFTSCSDDDIQTVIPDTTITGLASSRTDLSILVQALTRADLATTLQGSGPFTVFAPTNTAFTAFLSANGYANLEAVPVPALKEILLNHVISGDFESTDLVNNTYIKTLGKGTASATNTLSMYVNTTSGVRLNGVSSVTTPNIIASNGVIHIVNAVIGLPTIVTHATANPNFSSLVGALTGAGQPNFVSILSGTGPFTVFAPTNTAFTNLNTELAAIPFTPSTSQLTSVLQYHVVNGNVLASALPGIVSGPSAGVVPTLNAQNITISLTGGAKITGTFSPTRSASNIVATDVQCSNGAIHVLDKVLLPTL